MSISVLDSAYVNSPATNRTLRFPQKSSNSVNLRTGVNPRETSKIWLPKSALRESVNHRGQSKAAFFLYQNLHRVTRGAPVSLSANNANHSPSQFVPIGKIISASVGRDINLEVCKKTTHWIVSSWNNETFMLSMENSKSSQISKKKYCVKPGIKSLISSKISVSRLKVELFLEFFCFSFFFRTSF